MDLRVGPTVFENRNGRTKQANRFIYRAKRNYVTITRPLLFLVNKIRHN
jgi:hypothetical protein